MRERAGRRRHRQEEVETQRPEPPRQRAAERQKPQHVEADMGEVGVQQRIGDEAPYLGAGAAGNDDIERRGVVAQRNEAERIDGPVLRVRRQQHAQMDHREQHDVGGERGRQCQDRFARRFGRKLRQFRLGFVGKIQGVDDLTAPHAMN
jgi:hypothetical protein